MELILVRPALYRVRRGQTAAEIARAFGVPARVFAAANALTKEVQAGELVRIPPKGNVFRVRGGETRALLCGSAENFRKKNATASLYPTQEVLL